MAIPKSIKIKREEGYHTDQIGVTEKGKQFMGFVVAASESADKTTNQDSLRWYAVLHIFEANGKHLKSQAICAGKYAEGAKIVEIAENQLKQMIQSLGRVSYRDVKVGLFQVQVDGVTFGLVDASVPEEKYERIDLIPNDLAFFAPWNGLYDT